MPLSEEEKRQRKLAQHREWKKRNIEHVRAYQKAYQAKYRKEGRVKVRKHYLKYKYGMGEQEYERLLEEQNGLCAICLGKCFTYDRLSVDHCHSSGKIRGLLCQNCNTGIGHLKDCPTILRRAVEYLER